MSQGKKRAFVALASVALTVGALGSPVVAQDEEQTLVYALDGEMTFLNNAANDVPTAEATQWIHSALYGYDQTLTPVPNLAKDFAQVSEDGLTWTIDLVDNAFFQPTGEKLTAKDVEFTYRIANSPNCRFNPQLCLAYVTVTPEGSEEAVPILESVTAIDEDTVEFVIADVYAPWVSVILPGIFIDSRTAVRAAFEKFEAATSDIREKAVNELTTQIEEAEDLVPLIAEMERILGKAELPMPDRVNFPATDDAGNPTGETDEAAYADALALLVLDLSDILQADAIDRIAAAYQYLETARAPVGLGPFYVTEFRPGQDVTAVKNPTYHLGASEIDRLVMPIIKDDVAASAALKAGDLDWKYSLTADALAQLEGDPALKFARYPDFGYFGLQFNLREGRLFSEKPVRQALAYCIDKEATVEAATDGQGVPVWADIPPASWAYNPDIPKIDNDLDMAAQLLDEAGWTLAEGESVRARDGQPLATTILVRAGKPDRIKFMQLLADQAKDCGFDITITEADFATVLLPGLEYPHVFPGTSEAWDAYFGGWGTSYDPDPYSIWHSSQCTTAELPDTYNYICFQNERADELIEAGLKELDQEKRAEIYQEFEAILAEELPYLFAWSDEASEGVNFALQGGEPWDEETMTSPTWFWELEKVRKTTIN
jgi:ABC-type transport system substrate-binding protein